MSMRMLDEDGDGSARLSIGSESPEHSEPPDTALTIDARDKRTGSRGRLAKSRRKPADAGGRRRPMELALAESEPVAFSPPASPLLASVNSTTSLVVRRADPSEDPKDTSATSSSRRRKTQQERKAAAAAAAAAAKRSSSSNARTTARDSYKAPRRVVPEGKFRYLKPDEIQRGQLKYDFAVIVNRSVKVPSRVAKLLSDCLCCCCKSGGGSSENGAAGSFHDSHSHERLGFRRLCLVSSPLLRESEDEHRRIVDKLCGQGLLVDIIDGGHSKGEMNSAYFILLVRASDAVVLAYLQQFRVDLWMAHGAVADMELDIVGRNDPPTPAERVQIVDFIIEQRANLTTRDPWVHDMFPMHDKKLADKLISTWVASWRVVELADKKVLKQLRSNFGEKVAYYFAFISYYNRALLPLAALGVLLQVLHGVVSTPTYMRMLPFWGIGVSVVWSFAFLKSWQRRNASMQFEWNKKLHGKQIEYANKHFYGEKAVNSLTGEVEVVYPAWRRLPKYFCVGLFMLLQMVIMLVLVAVWVTVYEMLKAKYPDGRIFSTQWFLILLEGMVFGVFVDVIQWNMVVTKMGALFTHWENYRTEEQFERALIRKLFLLDFLNYYTWFFSLAFVFVIPGFGDYLTNSLNRMTAGDAMNCCFGPYVDQHGVCLLCPLGPKDATCIECAGVFTFDRHHVDLSAMFVTPIVVTQLLNMAIGLLGPKLVRARREYAQAAADADAQKRVMAAGSMKILGSLDYEDRKASQFSNKSHARYLEYSAAEIEVLNRQARELLFDSEQESYDPYNDLHALTVQYGFTVMFSILWPLMPLACYGINLLKVRSDGYRLCKTLKRPIPRRANGIGAWQGVLTVYAYIAVVVNVLLICISTGAIEFFDETCVRDIANQLAKQGKTLDDFVLGPDFGCLHVTWRLLLILALEHVLLGAAYVAMTHVPAVPRWIHIVRNARENQFKELLREHERDLFPPVVVLGSGAGESKRQATTTDDDDDKDAAKDDAGVLLSESRIDIAGLVSRSSRGGSLGLGLGSAAAQAELLAARSISVDSVDTPVSENETLEVPTSDGFRSKAREQLARQWSAGSE